MQLIEFLMDYYTTHNEDGSMTGPHTSAVAPQWHKVVWENGPCTFYCRCADEYHELRDWASLPYLNALEAEASALREKAAALLERVHYLQHADASRGILPKDCPACATWELDALTSQERREA